MVGFGPPQKLCTTAGELMPTSINRLVGMDRAGIVAKYARFYLPNFFNFSAIALNAAGISLFLSAWINGAIFITESA